MRTTGVLIHAWGNMFELQISCSIPHLYMYFSIPRLRLHPSEQETASRREDRLRFESVSLTTPCMLAAAYEPGGTTSTVN